VSEDPNLVVIGGKSVDINDPCALCRALQAYRIKLMTGGGVEEIEVRSPVTTRRTKFHSGSKVEDLDRLIAEARSACEASIGGVPKRTRYAIRGTFRPY
jgi:hypothetical protein